MGYDFETNWLRIVFTRLRNAAEGKYDARSARKKTNKQMLPIMATM